MSKVEAFIDEKQLLKANANIHQEKVRVRVSSNQDSVETFETLGEHDWPLNHFFYIRHKDDNGKETIYKLALLCPDCGDRAGYHDRCPAKVEDPI